MKNIHKEKISNRLDLSEWVIHFIHNRKPENDPGLIFGDGDRCNYPFNFLEKKKKTFYIGEYTKYFPYDDWHYYDESYPIEDDATAFQVLIKILDDAHIRSNWSFRNYKPTIYGYNPAVCFTEMPLYALFDYVKKRGGSNYVDSYAICLKKNELFKAGGRPVIYGLTGNVQDPLHHLKRNDSHWGPRVLDQKLGIGVKEQYRYVPTNLSGDYPIDWTHEREWRWADCNFISTVPGLPLFGKDEQVNFSEIVILVREKSEVDKVAFKIKELFDAKRSNYGYEYSVDTLKNISILSFEEVMSTYREPGDLKTLKLDDLPRSQMRKFKVSKLDKKYIEQVKDDLEIAKQLACQAIDKHIENLKPDSKGRVGHAYGFGFSWLCVENPESKFVQALIKLKKIKAYGGFGYCIDYFLSGANDHGQREFQERGAIAAKEYLNSKYPDVGLYVDGRWD